LFGFVDKLENSRGSLRAARFARNLLSVRVPIREYSRQHTTILIGEPIGTAFPTLIAVPTMLSSQPTGDGDREGAINMIESAIGHRDHHCLEIQSMEIEAVH
jgi:hypothetical protein